MTWPQIKWELEESAILFPCILDFIFNTKNDIPDFTCDMQH